MANIGIILDMGTTVGTFSVRRILGALQAVSAFLALSLSGCVSGGDRPPLHNTLKLEMDSISVKDSIIDSNDIRIRILNRILYPANLADDKNSTQKTQRIICASFLGDDKQLTPGGLENIIRASVKEKIESYRMPVENGMISADMKDETPIIRSYDICTSLSLAYHNYDFLCMEKASTTIKDGKRTMESSEFITIDLPKAERLSISDLFPEDSYPAISDLIKSQLLSDSGCKSADQLVELGYFNIDFLSVTDNFSLSDDGICFHYNPYEIACYALGKVSISIPYSDIRQYLLKDSPIQRIIK